MHEQMKPTLIVAAVTPLVDGGRRLDEAAIPAYAEFLAEHGADGVFACGTTGEGVLLALDERRRLAAAFRAAVRGTLIVHAGAQTTGDTCTLAAHAAEIGADGVAVIAPPYFPLDDAALTDHFVAAARACAPLPFYCYAFSARSGYPLPPHVIHAIRERTDNLAGLKVSEPNWEAVAAYLELGLPVLVGSEPLIPVALSHGAAGSVSGMAAAFPDVVRAALDDPSPANAAHLTELRRAMEANGQFIAAAKHALGQRSVRVGPDPRPPLRRLTQAEIDAFDQAAAAYLPVPA